MDDVPEIFRKFAEDHPLPAPRRPLPDPEMADATTLASTEVGPTLHIVHEEGRISCGARPRNSPGEPWASSWADRSPSTLR